jgi:transposase
MVRFRRFTRRSGARRLRQKGCCGRHCLQLLYTIRWERQLVERIKFDLLFRWFVGLSNDEKIFDASTLSKNRDRLLTQEIPQRFCLRFAAFRK